MCAEIEDTFDDSGWFIYKGSRVAIDKIYHYMVSYPQEAKMPFTTSDIVKLLGFVTDTEPVISLGLSGPQYGPTEIGSAKVYIRWLDVEDIGLDVLFEGKEPIKVLVSAKDEPALYEQLCGVVQSLVGFKSFVESQIAKAAAPQLTAK